MSLILSSTDADTPPALVSCISLPDWIPFPLPFQDVMPLNSLSTPSVTFCIHSSTAFGTPSDLITHSNSALGTWILILSSIFCSILVANAFSLSVIVLFTLVMSFLLPVNTDLTKSVHAMHAHKMSSLTRALPWALCILCKTSFCMHCILLGQACVCQFFARFGYSLCNSISPYFRLRHPSTSCRY